MKGCMVRPELVPCRNVQLRRISQNCCEKPLEESNSVSERKSIGVMICEDRTLYGGSAFKTDLLNH